MSSSDGPRIPVVRATSSGEELRARTRENGVIAKPEVQTRRSHDAVDTHTLSVTEHLDTSEVEIAQPLFEKPTNPRRFELAQFSPEAGDNSQMSKANSALKSTSHFTTFIETSTAEKLAVANEISIPASRNEVDKSVSSVRRRPGPSFLRTHQSSPVSPLRRNQPDRSYDIRVSKLGNHETKFSPARIDESDELAQQLENIALEFISRDEQRQAHHSALSPDVLGNGGLAQRDANADDDYVFETYLRKPVHDDMCLLGEGSARDTRHVGYLVIRENEEGLWDTYVEDEEDDNRDEEDYDSNAEDNPANDYPEEVDSDEQSWSDVSEDGKFDVQETDDRVNGFL